MNFFSVRKDLAEKYEEWRKENNVKDCALSVIAYLECRGLLKDVQDEERKENI